MLRSDLGCYGDLFVIFLMGWFSLQLHFLFGVSCFSILEEKIFGSLMVEFRSQLFDFWLDMMFVGRTRILPFRGFCNLNLGGLIWCHDEGSKREA